MKMNFIFTKDFFLNNTNYFYIFSKLLNLQFLKYYTLGKYLTYSRWRKDKMLF